MLSGQGAIPLLLEHDRFRLRPITVEDVDKDYDAVMSSREHLWRQCWIQERWPFERVVYPGRELPLDRYEALPDR
jgi:hypothetical protein